MQPSKSPILLKNNQTTFDRRLDRIFQDDPLNANYPIRGLMQAQGLLAPRSYTWPVGPSVDHQIYLDQGQEGECVQYAILHEMAARPVLVDWNIIEDIRQQKGIYWPAQQEDEWPGGSYPGADPFYEGTSVLAGMKVATRLGHYRGYAWTKNAYEAAVVTSRKGPVVLGINWHEGMYEPDSDGFVHPTGEIVGGHAILSKGYSIRHQAVILHNSWGMGWGRRGTAKLKLDGLQFLLDNDGECCLPLRQKYSDLVAR